MKGNCVITSSSVGGNKAICRPRYALLRESLFWGPNATTFLYPVSVGT